MKTLNISISDLEFKRFGLKPNCFSFSELVDIVSQELLRQRLKESIETARKYVLKNMTMNEITHEEKATRKNAKNFSRYKRAGVYAYSKSFTLILLLLKTH